VPALRPSRGVFAVTAAGGLLVSLDVSVANALLPAIGADFLGNGRAAVSGVGVLGSSAAPSLGAYRAVWVLAAGFSAVAAVVALLLPSGVTDSAREPVPSPHRHLSTEECSA
jgi:hypothetical protein